MKYVVMEDDSEDQQLTKTSSRPYSTFGHLIALIALGVFMAKSGLGWWWHAPYEYRADIRELKADGTDVRYTHFPDELPQAAENVHWICRPGMLQGSPAKMLYFNASAEYVQGIMGYYKDIAIVYTYQNSGGWDAGEYVTKDGTSFWYEYLMRPFTEEQCERFIIYVTYLSEENESCGGVFVDPVDNLVYYFLD